MINGGPELSSNLWFKKPTLRNTVWGLSQHKIVLYEDANDTKLQMKLFKAINQINMSDVESDNQDGYGTITNREIKENV